MSAIERKLRVFLSYAREDVETVREIYNRLNSEEWIEPWQDTFAILPGENWTFEIRKAIDSSDVIIVVLSENSVIKEGFIHTEMHYAWNRSLQKPPGTIFLIPVRLEDCEIPLGFYDLEARHWVDYFGVGREDAYSRLIKSLDKRLQEKKELERRQRKLEEKREELRARREAKEREAEEERQRILAAEKAQKEQAEKERKEKAEREAAEKAEQERIAKAKQEAEEEQKRKVSAEKDRQEKIEKLLNNAIAAIKVNNWQLAKLKFQEVLILDTEHSAAQANLKIIEKKLTELKAQEEKERKEKEARKAEEKIKRERIDSEKREAEEKVRLDKIQKLLSQADVAIVSQDWELAKKQLEEVLGLDARHVAAQSKLRIVEKKLEIIAIAKAGKTRPAWDDIDTDPGMVVQDSGVKEIIFNLSTIQKLSLLIAVGGMVFVTIFSIIYLIRTSINSSAAFVMPSTTPVATEISPKDGMTLVYIPAGEFQMGSEDGYNNEMPIHTVYLDNYWFDQTEITNNMYSKCVEAGACGSPRLSSSSTRDRYYNSSYYADKLLGDYPVIYVSWKDANLYCTWAGRRLPTEAEWEKASGWNEDTQSHMLYPWGNKIDDTYANYNQNIGDTTSVNSYAQGKSFYGAYNMAGNVGEWVADWYSESYYENSEISNPIGPDTGSAKVVRGGTWGSNKSAIRSSARSYIGQIINSSNSIGFRCAMDAD